MIPDHLKSIAARMAAEQATAPPKEKRKTLLDRAGEIGCSVPTLRSWQRGGCNVFDDAAVRNRIARSTKLPPGIKPEWQPATTGETLGEARRRLAIAQANRAEVLAAQAAGSVIDLNEAIGLFQRIALELKGRLMALRGELVPELEGKTPAQMHRLLDERFRDLLDAIHERRPIPPESNA